MTAISLLVCTRDRRDRLARLLASIDRAADHAPGVPIEVVVVDNGSADGTAALLARWASGRAFPTTLVREPAPGLARARNAGLARAAGRVIAMTDDDCVLRADYLAALRQRFADVRGAAIVGGRILPGDPDDLAVTIKLEDHAMTLGRFAFPGGFVMGANLAFTAAAAAIVGRFDERFGAGARFRSAEDTDWLLRAARRGVAVDYDPGLVVDHHHGRRGDAALRALIAGYAFGDGALYAKHGLRDPRIAAALLRDVAGLHRDVVAPGVAHAAIPRFYGFRLRHAAAGFASYAADALRRRGLAMGRGIPG